MHLWRIVNGPNSSCDTKCIVGVDVGSLPTRTVRVDNSLEAVFMVCSPGKFLSFTINSRLPEI